MSEKSEQKEQLDKYRQKRNFQHTREPFGAEGETGSSRLVFVVQKHAASHLHYDFRLEITGVLKSWAVPKGPSLNPKDKRLAVLVEDHPLEYANFEGTIPEPEYGAGTVLIWDKGYYTSLDPAQNIAEAFQAGHLEITLAGEKLKGGFVLHRTKFQGKDNNWLLIKKNDEQANPTEDILIKEPCSIISLKTIEELTALAGNR